MDLDINRLLARKWYYTIELIPGVLTPGLQSANLPIVRDFLERIDLKDQACLDIGSQEFVAPVLLLRQGASSVTAYDRLSLTEPYEAVKHCYAVDFDYVHGIELNELKSTLKRQQKRHVFDVVNFSGVLYHMIDPLAGLAIARSFLRTGGLMIVESAVKRSGDYILQFNAEGRLYPGSNYYQVSIATLDYWLRMLRLAPIDCATSSTADICRFVAICRAVDAVEPEEQDTWMGKHFITKEFEPYGVHYNELASAAEPVRYRESEPESLVRRPQTNSIDLWQTALKRRPHRTGPDRWMLKLDDRS